MKLCSLIKNLNARVFGNPAVEISGLYHKDTEVKENGLFFCLRGTRVDGNDFVYSAIRNGAVAIVTQQEIHGISGVTQVVVKNAREAMSLIACKFYGNPAEKLKLIGVTGTNGKTTITNMLASVLEKTSDRVAIIGTNGIFVKGIRYETNMTTPDPIELQKYLALMVKSHIKYVCIEVSAHAIDLHKIDGVKFEVVIFTNLTEDHLDYFKTMERYFVAKQALFSKKYAKFAVLNADDEYSKRLTKSINIPYVTYSNGSEADYFALGSKTENGRQILSINDYYKVSLPMLGKFNISNALAAVAALSVLEISKDLVIRGLEEMKQVDGRFNSYTLAGRTFIVDYAHTPDGLKNILIAARELAEKKRLISVFGCGGNRDSQKRPIMGEISDSLANFSIITSDNSRFEKPEDIIRDIVRGIKSDRYLVCLDRGSAIKKAFEISDEGDIIVIAGKGAEDYIEENGVKIPYSDYEEIEKIRRNL